MARKGEGGANPHAKNGGHVSVRRAAETQTHARQSLSPDRDRARARARARAVSMYTITCACPPARCAHAAPGAAAPVEASIAGVWLPSRTAEWQGCPVPPHQRSELYHFTFTGSSDGVEFTGLEAEAQTKHRFGSLWELKSDFDTIVGTPISACFFGPRPGPVRRP